MKRIKIKMKIKIKKMILGLPSPGTPGEGSGVRATRPDEDRLNYPAVKPPHPNPSPRSTGRGELWVKAPLANGSNGAKPEA